MAQALRTNAITGELLHARDLRVVNELMTEGGFDVDDFEVLQQATPNMTVRVGSGVEGDRYVVPTGRTQGTYIVRNPDPYVGDANSDVAVANGGADDRIDLVALQVYDDEFDDSGEAKSEVIVVEGVEAASPVVPDVPAGAVALAEVTVEAGLSSGITSGMIADRRVRANGYRSFTPEHDGITLGNGSLNCRYLERGDEVVYRVKLTVGSTTVFDQAFFTLPVTPRAGQDDHCGVAMYYDGTRNWVGVCYLNLTGDPDMLWFAAHTAGVGTGDVTALNPFEWQAGDVLTGEITYERAG